MCSSGRRIKGVFSKDDLKGEKIFDRRAKNSKLDRLGYVTV